MSPNLHLNAVTYRDYYESAPREEREACAQIMDLIGLAPFSPVDSIPCVQVNVHLADWNHAYHIWHRFTVHVQDGDARYEEIPVARETLQALLDQCNRLLFRRSRKGAEAALPLPRDLFRTRAESMGLRSAFWFLAAKPMGLAAMKPKKDCKLNNRKFISNYPSNT